MKKIIEHSLFFSYPERKALSYFFTLMGIVITFHYAFNTLFPPKIPDNEVYENLFMTESSSVANQASLYHKPEPTAQKKQEINRSPPKKEQKILVKEQKVPSSPISTDGPLWGDSTSLKPKLKPDSIIIDKKKNTIKVDINTAEEYELQYLKGIGPSFAARIVKYREMLGGYYKVEQLREVYGLDEKLFIQLQPQVFVSGAVKKLPINQKDPPFFRHPYLTYQQAKIIRAYVHQHGPVKNPEKLLDIKIMKPEIIEKIRPYLPE